MNHNIPNITVVPVDETEDAGANHEPIENQAVAELGGVGVDAAIESRTNPHIEHMKKVERAFFGSPDDLIKQIDEGEIGVNDVDFEDRTAVMMMTARGHAEAVEWLVAHGADLNHINMYQGRIPMSALDAARQTNRKALEQLLLDNGAKSGREIQAERLAEGQSQ